MNPTDVKNITLFKFSGYQEAEIAPRRAALEQQGKIAFHFLLYFISKGVPHLPAVIWYYCNKQFI